jgi:hypothetical protein
VRVAALEAGRAEIPAGSMGNKCAVDGATSFPGAARWGLLLLGRTGGGRLRKGLIHVFGGKDGPERHARKSGGVGVRLQSCRGDVVGTIDKAISGTFAIVEIPSFEFAADRFIEFSDACPESRGRLLLQILHPFDRERGTQEVFVMGWTGLLANCISRDQRETKTCQS